MNDVVLGIDQSIDRATAQAETVIDLFDVDNIRAYLLYDFVDNPEDASVTQIEASYKYKTFLNRREPRWNSAKEAANQRSRSSQPLNNSTPTPSASPGVVGRRPETCCSGA
jgi:hypothetical protein